GVSEDEAQAAATLTAIQAFAAATPTIYLPAHDPDAARRLDERRTVAGPFSRPTEAGAVDKGHEQEIV
ncbi:MAG TPA: hypothetical protein VF886_05430, partial [Roseiarcus sp.]